MDLDVDVFRGGAAFKRLRDGRGWTLDEAVRQSTLLYGPTYTLDKSQISRIERGKLPHPGMQLLCQMGYLYSQADEPATPARIAEWYGYPYVGAPNREDPRITQMKAIAETLPAEARSRLYDMAVTTARVFEQETQTERKRVGAG
jgi:transcriptional regulator with XRE-family HTH domain